MAVARRVHLGGFIMSSRVRHVSLIWAFVLVALLATSVAFAQPTRPAMPPNGGNGAAPAQPNGGYGEAPPPAMLNGGYQPSYYPDYYHYNTGWPGAEVRV